MIDEGGPEITKPTNEGKSKPEVVHGKGFVMEKTEPWNTRGSRSIPASVEMRTGASNEDVIKRLNASKEKLAKITPFEEMEKEWEKEKIRDASSEFTRLVTERGEYSETLQVNPDGQIDNTRRVGSDVRPFISFYDISTRDALYGFMKKLQEFNGQLDVQFENDPSGQWIKYRLTNKPTK